MSTRVVDRVDDWEKQSFAGGLHGLHEFADEGFSGVVRAGGAELFMISGTVVGIERGSIEDFEDAEGTVFEAPSPALPLLAVMQARSDEVRAKYYSEDTPISEVDGTLEDGNFTGFLELSENVLSGDYYLVYHRGESMAVAFVGESAQLLSDDEAYERADDEVGIYEVKPVDIEPIELPEVEESAPAAAPAEAEGGTAAESAEPEEAPAEAAAATAEAEGTATEPAPDAGDPEPAEPATEPADGDQEREPVTEDEIPGAGADATEAGATGTAADSGGSPTEPSGSSSPASGGSGGAGTASASSTDQPVEPAPKSGGSAGGSADGSTGGGQAAGPAGGSRSRNSGDASDLETRSIPSLDPEQSVTPQRRKTSSARGDSPGSRGAGHRSSEAQTERVPEPEPDPEPEPRQERASEPEPAAEPESGAAGQVADLQSQLDEREAKIERLESELEDAESERLDLEEELETVREERDELQAEVERLEEEIDHLEEEFGAAVDSERRITPREALDGTDIFVRYHSKGDATLEKAHEGSVRKDDVVENLRLEKHTQFDSATVAVGGQGYDEFLEARTEYQFVRWVVEDLLFEIRDTGHADALKDLYDALPKVDRAELNGVVEVVYTEDGQETRTQESFDVVLRDRMGNPLLMANLNDSRQGATESMMTELVTAAERVGKGSETMAAAFLVTLSFFEPDALETASEATRSGILSRDKRTSFVNLTRKSGFHLCLVEARNENFHLAVPEL